MSFKKCHRLRLSKMGLWKVMKSSRVNDIFFCLFLFRIRQIKIKLEAKRVETAVPSYIDWSNFSFKRKYGGSKPSNSCIWCEIFLTVIFFFFFFLKIGYWSLSRNYRKHLWGLFQCISPHQQIFQLQRLNYNQLFYKDKSFLCQTAKYLK